MASRNAKSNVEEIGEEIHEEVAHGAQRIVEEIKHGAEVATERLKPYAGKAKEVLHTANNTTLAEVEDSAIKYAKENPGKTLLGAAAVGFLVGFLIRGGR